MNARTWPVDRLRAAHSAWVCGDRTPEAVLGHREYNRRWMQARRRSEIWPPTPAAAPALPALPARRVGDPPWTDAQLRAAGKAYRAGSTDPVVLARNRFYVTLCRRECRRRAREAQAAARLRSGTVALLADVADMAATGETLAAVAARLERTEQATERSLRRFGPAGVELLARLRENEPTHGHVRHATLRRAS